MTRVKFGLSSSCALLALTAALSACNSIAQSAAMEANHMRFKGHDAVLDHATAWQKQSDGHWVTFVLLSDRPISADAAADDPNDAVTKAGAQALLFPVLTGGLPLQHEETQIWFHNGDSVSSSAVNGQGGFDIETLTADHIKGRAISGWAKDDIAWLVNFDAPIAHGDAARMAAEGESLGKDGGAPGKDMVAALDAKKKKDAAAMKKYFTPEIAKSLDDPKDLDKTLELYKNMASDRPKITGGLRNGDHASVYWTAVWDGGVRNNRCVDSMVLIDGTWRMAQSSCSVE